MKQTQLLKGTLEGCVLLIISEHEVYGYEMVQQLRDYGFVDMVGGTVYPLLQKLEKQGFLSSQLKPSSDGPNRKYYQLTKLGADHCREFMVQWEDLTIKVNRVIKLKGENVYE